MKFSEAYELWDKIRIRQVRENTHIHQTQTANTHVLPHFGDMEIADITHSGIQDYIDGKVVSGLQAASIEKQLTIVRKVLYYAAGPSNSAAVSGLLADLILPRPVYREIQVFTADEVTKLLDAVRPKWMRDVVTIAYRTGMRRSEIFGLQWQDVNFDDRFLSIRRGATATKPNERIIDVPKTRKSMRRIDLDNATLDVLSRRRKTARCEWVIENQYGRPISPWYVTKYMHNGCVKADILPRGIHTLRHTHATMLLAAGVNPKIVQERLGHATIQMTLDLYSHMLPTMQQVVVDVFNSIP